MLLWFASLAAAQTPAVPPAAVATARDYLQNALADETLRIIALSGLRSTGDAELLPLFEAQMRRSDREGRLLAAAMAGKVAGELAAPALQERLRSDPVMAVRAEALVQLLLLKAVTTPQLQAAMTLEDEGLASLAARALVQRGKGALAMPTLQKLAASHDSDTAAYAKMSLFGLGDTPQIRKNQLRTILLDPKTSNRLLMGLLNQIRDENIKDAREVAQYLTDPKYPRIVRVQAYMTLADLLPSASKTLTGAILAKNSDLFRVNLLRILAEQSDAKYWLDDLARRGDLLGAVARFELARPGGGPAAERALRELVIDLGHPILIEYALNRMRSDVEKRPDRAAFYVEPMLQVLRSADLPAAGMTPQHDRLALLVELLANVGTPPAMAGLREILAGPSSPTKMLTAGALYRSTNPAVCDLARPLLSSALTEHRLYAALTLARHGDRDAVAALLDVQAHADTHRPDVLTLTNWYLLKLSGDAQSAVQVLAEKVK